MNELDDVDDLLGGSGIERSVTFQDFSFLTVRSFDGCYAGTT